MDKKSTTCNLNPTQQIPPVSARTMAILKKVPYLPEIDRCCSTPPRAQNEEIPSSFIEDWELLDQNSLIMDIPEVTEDMFVKLSDKTNSETMQKTIILELNQEKLVTQLEMSNFNGNYFLFCMYTIGYCFLHCFSYYFSYQ